MGAGRSSFTALKDARVRRGSETSAFQNGLFDMTQAPDRSVVTADGRTLIFPTAYALKNALPNRARPG